MERRLISYRIISGNEVYLVRSYYDQLQCDWGVRLDLNKCVFAGERSKNAISTFWLGSSIE